MNLLTTNGVKIYNVSAGKSLPEWLSEKKKSELKKNEEFRQRIELIQDFSFETSSRRVKITPDGQYLMATGIYPPQVKIFELSQLSCKVSRNLESHVIQFEVLSDDYSKPIFLREDRYIEFHAKYGTYFKTRVPKLGRDMSYHRPSCDLYVGAGGNEVYRLNLEEGRFLAPLVTDLPAVNVVAQNPVHQLMMFGGENGVIECWDPRQKSRVSSFNVGAAASGPNGEEVEITAGKFGPDGLSLGLGTSGGTVFLYDLRSPHPSMIKHHQYQLPINSINFHSFAGQQRLLSADSKILKAFDKDTGKIFMTLEPKSPITDVLSIDGTGLILMPGETQKIQSYYVPALGPAPRWSSFLDNLTEELEEDKQLVYEDYKFITRDEVEKLNLEKLIGTGLMKAYMHGYFIHVKLYNKVKAIQNPFEYEQWRAQKVAEEMKKETGTRIKAVKPNKVAPKINSKLANRLEVSKTLETKESGKEKAAAAASGLLNDPRFGALWNQEDFTVDEESAEFRRHNPRAKLQKLDAAVAEHFNNVEEDSDDDEEDDDDEMEDVDQEDDEDDEEDGDMDEEEMDREMEKMDADEDYDEGEDIAPVKGGKDQKKKKVNFYEIKTGHTVSSIANVNKNAKLLKNAPFSIRVDKEEKGTDYLNQSKILKKDSGDYEISFIPSANSKSKKKGGKSFKK
eukprot:gene20049-24040_t